MKLLYNKGTARGVQLKYVAACLSILQGTDMHLVTFRLDGAIRLLCEPPHLATFLFVDCPVSNLALLRAVTAVTTCTALKLCRSTTHTYVLQ